MLTHPQSRLASRPALALVAALLVFVSADIANAQPGDAEISPVNAATIVVGTRDGREIARWAGALDWQGPMPIEFVGTRAGKVWSWEPHEPAELRIQARADRWGGIEIARWAREHQVTWVRIIIVPMLDDPTGPRPGSAETRANHERSSPGKAVAHANASADSNAAPDDDAVPDDAAEQPGAGLGDRGTGSGRGQHGDPRQPGTGSGQGRGYAAGSEDPSWHDNHRAELVTENAGRTPADGGKRGGSAGGEPGGDGNVHGLGLWGGLFDAPDDVAPLVSAGLVLADANFTHFSQKFLSRAVRGMGTRALGKELEQEAAQVVSRELTRTRDQLARSPAYKNLSGPDQEALLAQTRESLERAYYHEAGRFFRAQAQRSQNMATRYAQATDQVGKHIHTLTTENAAAYRKMADAADGAHAKMARDGLDSMQSDPKLLGPKTSARELRRQRGTAIGGETLTPASGHWLRGTHANAAPLPGQVAEALRGRTFKNWDSFREAVWKTVAADKALHGPFSPRDITLMKQGKAPSVDVSQRIQGLRSYVLHHRTPIQHGGGVYDMDNILVVTPRYHKEVLDRSYHY